MIILNQARKITLLLIQYIFVLLHQFWLNLYQVFTAILHNTFLPDQLKDCVLVSIPKTGKNLSLLDSYHPISLALSLSKVLEWCLLLQSAPFFTCSDLQFGFKEMLSTCLCTGALKSIVSRYIPYSHRKKQKTWRTPHIWAIILG